MEKVAKNEIKFDYEKEEKIFKLTFDFLSKCMGSDIFSTMKSSGSSSENFVKYYYDAFTMGVSKIVQENILDVNKIEHLEKIQEKFKNLKDKDTIEGSKLYSKRTGSKTNLISKQKIVFEYLRGINE